MDNNKDKIIQKVPKLSLEKLREDSNLVKRGLRDLSIINPAKETFDTLWEYCTSNNRLCPMPMKWNDLFGMLKNTKQNLDGGWTPSLPLILFAWDTTMPIEKQLRFQEHIQWASDNNQVEKIGKYLRSLSENDWAHYGEI